MFLAGAGALAAMQTRAVKAFGAQAASSSGGIGAASESLALPHARPVVADRKFTSSAVEDAITSLQRRIADPALRVLVENCLPNTLDTTVYPGAFDSHPDTFVVTGDIDAMWLRDSSAQVWPYLRFAKQDQKLRSLLEGVVRRQARMIQLDPYANAFTRDTSVPPLSWAVHDDTEHHAGVAERKWEIDSLCYTIRLAHGYWQATGAAAPFDAQWKAAAEAIVQTFTEQQRQAVARPVQFPASGGVALRYCPALRLRQPGSPQWNDLQACFDRQTMRASTRCLCRPIFLQCRRCANWPSSPLVLRKTRLLRRGPPRSPKKLAQGHSGAWSRESSALWRDLGVRSRWLRQ